MTSKHTGNRARRAAKPLALAALAVLATTGSAAATTDSGATTHSRTRCDQGEFCTWDARFYRGPIQRFDLRTTNTDECVPLPAGTDGRSFTNRTTRDITVYQGRDCSTEGDFATYPGGGTYVPSAPFVVRAIQIWG